MHLTDFKDENPPTLPRGMNVRKLKEIDDYEQFVSVLNEAFRPISGFQPTTIEKTKNIHEFRKKQREVDFFVAYETGHLLGFCDIDYDPKKAIGYVQSLAVHPKYQHRGLGKYLVVEGIKQLRSKKCKHIELQAVVGNENAVSLYQSVGFHAIEKMKGKCYLINTTGEIIEKIVL